MHEGRVRRTGEQWEYRCDGCEHWGERVWLVRGRLLCLACYTVSDELDLFERLKRACDLSEALQRQRQRRRGLSRESRNGQRGPPGQWVRQRWGSAFVQARWVEWWK